MSSTRRAGVPLTQQASAAGAALLDIEQEQPERALVPRRRAATPREHCSNASMFATPVSGSTYAFARGAGGRAPTDPTARLRSAPSATSPARTTAGIALDQVEDGRDSAPCRARSASAAAVGRRPSSASLPAGAACTPAVGAPARAPGSPAATAMEPPRAGTGRRTGLRDAGPSVDRPSVRREPSTRSPGARSAGDAGPGRRRSSWAWSAGRGRPHPDRLRLSRHRCRRRRRPPSRRRGRWRGRRRRSTAVGGREGLRGGSSRDHGGRHEHGRDGRRGATHRAARQRSFHSDRAFPWPACQLHLGVLIDPPGGSP